jgi:chromosome segregation protein
MEGAPLLKLRRVDLAGFKSFCEKTHLTFSGTGLTCIVGPNGCGKSNIVDAISWVLGEQSHKSLRAERMADCIFNGTAKRPPMGLAEVTLTLVDPELAEAARKVLGDPEPNTGTTLGASEDDAASDPAPELAPQEPLVAEEADPAAAGDVRPFRKKRAAQPVAHTRPGEVVIGRRLYRSGQSEYLINGHPARLRDIQELFMGIGLGPDSYAIIEQGRIGQVLSSKPSDRRAIIEEAAGITKYKNKKRLAEAKLDSSKVNLARVNDIYVEVEKQLASLKRQASKARRYTEMRDQMRALLRQILAGKAGQIEAETERFSRLVGEIASQETAETAASNRLEAEQMQLDRRTEELDAELRQNQNLIGMAALELDRAENRIVFNRQRHEELRLRGEQLAGQAAQVAAQIAQAESRLAEQGGLVADLRDDASRLERLLAELGDRSAELLGVTEATEAESAGLRRQIAELQEALVRLQETERETVQSLAHNAGALERLEQSERQVLEESLHYRGRSETAEIRWQHTNDRARSLAGSVQALQARAASLQQERQQAATRCESLREALSAARARRQTLERILNDRSYTAEAVQKLFASPGSAALRDFRAVGVLADYAEVESQYENAVEQFLRDELEYVVVETFDHARAGIAILRDEVGGRATFFVDSLRTLRLPENEPVVPFAADPALVSRLDQLLEFRDPLGPAAKQFLPRLRSAFLVTDAEAAERLAARHAAYSFLTPDGTCYQGRVVTGGRPTEAGPLVMKREMRSLETEIRLSEDQLAEAQARVEQTQAALQQCERDLQELAAQEVEAGKAVVAATLERDSARAELARLGLELSECQGEIARLRREASAAQQRLAQLAQEREHAARDRASAEQALQKAAGKIVEMRKMTDAQQERLASVRAEKAALDERFTSAAALATRLDEQRQELTARAAGLSAQQAELQREHDQIESQTAQQQQQTEVLRAERRRLETRKTALESEWAGSRERAAAVDDALRSARQKLAELREDRSRREIDRARNDAEREHLRAACLDELNAHPEDLLAEQAVLLAGEELAAADAQHREMKTRIESMGPVNMMALEEYKECEQRFAFLERERQDLLQSISDTQQAITELDQVSRQKFEEAFAVVNSHFATAFQTLFGGGTGQMRLSEPDSAGEPGIDIVAQPPGKRLQNVLLLSGGEKALTALALLIAIFRYQPSPFCILDEVDAPLDETNVGRFAQMVTEMSADAQFIVVTHNRRTMEMASALYGVTMQEPGVSKLVSVSWEQARAAASSNAA